VRCAAVPVELDGETLHVHGQLRAAGRQIRLALDAKVREIDEGRPPMRAITLDRADN
jgi:hypothetical protein